MVNKNSANVSLWSNFVRNFKKITKLFLKSTRQNRLIIERIHLHFQLPDQ